METIEKQLSSEIKEIALKYGASLVGIVSTTAYNAHPTINVKWDNLGSTKKITDIMPNSKSIVVVGYHFWDDMLDIAIKKDDEWIYPGYFPLTTIKHIIKSHLETKGYTVYDDPFISLKRVAQLAGFGNYGKNALIINPIYGPWIRQDAILTDAKLAPDKPFTEDLCENCERCIKACPVDALSPYKIDYNKCLVGVQLLNTNKDLERYKRSFTKNSHLMCVVCQKACPYGREKHN
ncbi:MAG: epoxyqueuosine reductase [Candidatus Bathyarchaeota archaeon]|nr:MAG: epoxyqueuosine reductase [Candidatus Bathyarchaeota archaeon]